MPLDQRDYEDIYFNRSYVLIVGFPGQDEPSLFVDHLRTSFSVNRSLEPFPDTAFVEIYNLSREAKNRLYEATARTEVENFIGGVGVRAIGDSGELIGEDEPFSFQEVTLSTPSINFRAGYQGNNESIIRGDITQVFTSKSGTDIITSFDIGDSLVAFTDAKVNMSFGPGARYIDVLNQLLLSLDMDVAYSDNQAYLQSIINFDDVFPHGIVLSGMAKDQLDKLLNRQGLTWSIQGQKVQILPPNEPIPEPPIIVDKFTGLVGSPFDIRVLEDPAYPRFNNQELKSGVHLRSLLNPEIKPGRRIDVWSQTSNGSFIVTKLRHWGDTHENPWYTDVIAERIS